MGEYSWEMMEAQGRDLPTLLDPDGDDIGEVETDHDAEVLIPYLNAGKGGFTLVEIKERHRHVWGFEINDCSIAYATTEESGKGILSHLNRNQ